MTSIPYLSEIVGFLSLLLGLFGVIIIIIGSTKSSIEYIQYGNESFQKIRLLFSQHLIIGLDFFVGKDIIDTMLIYTGESFWKELSLMIVVVFIRIVLTVMADRELETIKKNVKREKLKEK